MSEKKEKKAFLDTTVQIDRKKSGARREILDALLAEYKWTFGTSISLLEFKSTLIQECVTIHNELVGKRFSRVRDSLVESSHPQSRLRSHIFNNLLQIWASSHEIGEAEDRQMAVDARLNLEIIIPELFNWFTDEGVDMVLRDRINCTRALEPPFKKKAAFDNSMPVCDTRKGNKHCAVEGVIREHGPTLIATIKPTLTADDTQLSRAITIFEDVIADAKADLNHRKCRSCGDCLMAIEAEGNATHALSSNVREWERLASAVGMTFVRTSFEGERTN